MPNETQSPCRTLVARLTVWGHCHTSLGKPRLYTFSLWLYFPLVMGPLAPVDSKAPQSTPGQWAGRLLPVDLAPRRRCTTAAV